jgi:hypothetical protein
MCVFVCVALDEPIWLSLIALSFVKTIQQRVHGDWM